ncbi:MAG: hypothetical protein Q9207_006392 [Kuettlingeria erythrocarpa]
MDRVGKERMHSVVEKLGGSWGFEKLLFFGFGARCFVHVMADAQSGVNCNALCSALGEIYNENAAAWIVDELWKLYGYPAQFPPSHSQLTALIKACSRVLTITEFSRIYGRMLGDTLKIVPVDISNTEDVAKALTGLFRISQGDIAKIAVMGGTSCAFIAGFANWVLNLKVHVEDEAGWIIFQDTPPEEAQVTVTYCRQEALSLVDISSTTFILRSDDDWMYMRLQSVHEANLTIQTPWDGCLTKVFGNTFIILIKAPTILEAFLGSTARIYQALALGESDVRPFLPKKHINFVETSYGIGFINSVVTIFAELKRVDGLFDEMQSALDVPFREALPILERTVLRLEVSLAFTIRELVSRLSCIAMDEGILPTVRGLKYMHNRQHRMVAKRLTRNWKTIACYRIQCCSEPAPVQFDILGELESSSLKQQPRQLDIKLEMLGVEKARDHELMVYYRAIIPGGPEITLQPGRISKAVLNGNGILTRTILRDA